MEFLWLETFFAKELILYQALLKYIHHHWGTLWRGSLTVHFCIINYSFAIHLLTPQINPPRRVPQWL